MKLQEEFIKDRKYKYFKEHLMEIFEEKEEWIDVEKYLLSCAFRIKNLLVLLEDPSNRDRFSQFDNFLPYRRIYAETLKEINRLLDGKDVNTETLDFLAFSGLDFNEASVESILAKYDEIITK